ncbi:hypothetical protein AMS58_01070 [Pseudoalteromonas porphyrae]|uniref:tetratricopeptide repeat-containing diguanylate cyclase n=1 Tax=Pseudoalteromonas porphyrae TaxID=187330 RepID=UPI0006BB3E5A|nr:tetratricopeptide repeat-containing diguanylate cyclase [Pseudoalteromonas porphyrae]KPH96684.1 hypothetical protein AMS58_01070 [Pseudoalteromonas porphyrae]
MMHIQQRKNAILAVLQSLIVSFVVCGYLFLNTVSAKTTFDEQWLTTQLATAEKKSIQDPTQAITYLTQLLSKHENNVTALQRSKLQIYLAENYLLNGELTPAIELEKQVSVHLDLLDNFTYIDYLLVQANIYNSIGDPKNALTALLEAKNKAELFGDDDLKGNVYSSLASYYVYNHDEIRAIDYFYKAYELISRGGNQLKLAYIESTMAKSYEFLFDFEKAIDLQNKALAYFLKNDLSFDIMVSYFHLAKIYLKLSRSQDAIDNANKMLKINYEVANPSFDYYAYIIIAEANLQLDNLDKAIDYLNLSNVYFHELEDVHNIIKHLYIQAEIELKKNNLTNASSTLEKARQLLANIPVENSVTLELKLVALQAQLAIQQGNYQQAVSYQQAHIELSAQYYNQVRELSRSRHKVQFDIKKVELEKQLLEKNKELNEFALQEIKQQQTLQKTAMLSVLLLFLVLLIFTWRQYRLRRKFSLLANTDFLTGVANRRKIMDLAELQWLQLKLDNQKFTLICFDLDHFKKINDNYGHPAGDLVLKAVTQISQRAIRESDFLGRIGGEEFLVVLNNTTSVEATEIAFRIKSDIEKEHIISDGQIIKITASFGVAQKSSELTSFKDLLKKADKALYTAKEHGRNRVEINE